MWVEVCVEVDEQVERLVRHTHVRNEDGSFRQLFRVVIGSVPKGTLALFWLKYVGLVGHHVQEGVCNRLVAAKGVKWQNGQERFCLSGLPRVSTSRFLRWRV